MSTEPKKTPKRVAIVLTDNYPYNTGEEFFEQEIETLAQAFSHIYVCPLRASADAELTRCLPANVSTFLLPPSRIASWQLRALAWLPRILWGKERMVEQKPWNFGHWGMDVRFASIALDARDRFVSVFPWNELDDADEVLIYSYWFFTGAAIGGMLRRNELSGKTVRVVARAHAYDVDEKDAPRGYIPSRRYVMDAVDKVYPISHYAARFLTQRFPHLGDKIEVRRLGVPQAPHVAREKPHSIHLVTCSHLAPYKRVWLTGEAVVVLSQRGHTVQWTHIGERDQRALDALRQKYEIKAPTAVLEFRGYMRNSDVRAYYSSTDLTCFVNSSDGEGVPVSIMEAQATGLPVVATDAGGTAEIVKDYDNGRVVPVETTPEELANAIEWVHQRTHDEYRALCQQALATWKSLSHAQVQYTTFVDGLVTLFDSSQAR